MTPYWVVQHSYVRENETERYLHVTHTDGVNIGSQVVLKNRYSSGTFYN